MSKGDVNYVFVGAGSTTASVATVQQFFGNFGGLSALNEDEVLHVQVAAAGTVDFFVGISPYITNNIGLKISPSLSTIDLPPMRVAAASQLQTARGASGLDYAYSFVAWARRP